MQAASQKLNDTGAVRMTASSYIMQKAFTSSLDNKCGKMEALSFVCFCLVFFVSILYSSWSETYFKPMTHLILHKVIKHRRIQLSNAVHHDGQINTLHLDFGLAPPCCWVLLFPRGALLNLGSRFLFQQKHTCSNYHINGWVLTRTTDHRKHSWPYCWDCFHQSVDPPDFDLPGPPAFWPDTEQTHSFFTWDKIDTIADHIFL